MSEVFYMSYETRFGGKEHYNDIITQFQNVRKFLYDAKSGLYYHAFDESRQAEWADKETGTSANFWLRAYGLVYGCTDRYHECNGAACL